MGAATLDARKNRVAAKDISQYRVVSANVTVPESTAMKQIVSVGILLIWLPLVWGCSHDKYPEMQSSAGEYRLQYLPSLSKPAEGQSPSELRTEKDARVEPKPSWVDLMRNDAARHDPLLAEHAQALIPWQDRYGPAYPDDVWSSFAQDMRELPETMWDDVKATFTNKWTLVGLSAAAAAGIALDATNANGCVADHYKDNGSQLNTFWDTVGDVGGNPGLHFAVAGAMYFSSFYNKDKTTYEVSKTLINALAINGLTTLALKGITNTESPNGDDFGWPSGHTSSTFCFATVMHEAYGPWVGVPLFAFASYVGYERIDARNHDFHDVISGALIGIFIGHAVYQNHQPRIFGMDLIPYADPQRGTIGVALSKNW